MRAGYPHPIIIKMEKIVCLFICVIIAFAFSSCKKGEASGVITDSGGVTGQTQTGDGTAVSSDKSKETKETTKKSKKNATVSTTTPMPETKAKDAVGISSREALEKMSDFYGSAYHVEQKDKKGNIQNYEVRDNLGNLYAKVEVNLKTSDAKEIIEHSGEINTFNLLV